MAWPADHIEHAKKVGISSHLLLPILSQAVKDNRVCWVVRPTKDDSYAVFDYLGFRYMVSQADGKTKLAKTHKFEVSTDEGESVLVALPGLAATKKSLHQEYLRWRRECDYEDGHGITKVVWDGCDVATQMNMVAQMRAGAEEAAAAKLAQGPNWGVWG